MTNRKIIRTATRAEGGITDEERARMAEHVKLWTARAFRTEPIDPAKLVPAIHGIYAAAGLSPPRVVIAPSPIVMAFAYGAAAAIWHRRNNALPHAATNVATSDATAAATSDATESAIAIATAAALVATTHAATSAAADGATRAAVTDATYAPTDASIGFATAAVTFNVLVDATDGATAIATDAATDGAAAACYALAGKFGLQCAARWASVYQGGAYWVGWECYLTAARDILGLRLPAHAAYAHWEQAAIHGAFRVMHEKFCIVSDFPEFIRVDDQNRPHCDFGPSHRWRDGWSLYHWHGVAIPAEWVEQRDTIPPETILACPDTDKRAAGLALIGYARAKSALKYRILDGDPTTDLGALVELTIPGLPRPGLFLEAVCPRNGPVFLGIAPVNPVDNLPVTTAVAAQAFLARLPASAYQHPPIRT